MDDTRFPPPTRKWGAIRLVLPAARQDKPAPRSTSSFALAAYMKKRNWYGAVPSPDIRLTTRAKTFA